MSAAFRPLPGGRPSWVPSGALRSPNSRSYGFALDRLAVLEAERLARPGPTSGRVALRPLSLAWM